MRWTRRSRKGSRDRSLAPRIDLLESRELLSTIPSTLQATPSFLLTSNATGSPPSSALTPAQVRAAYGFNNISFGGIAGDGTGQTIAIVDAYDNPNIQNDLNVFSDTFGLPRTTVTRYNQSGGASLPGTDRTGGWEMESALDVEWAHAIAPGANIILVEARSASDSDLLAAVDFAAAHASVVSMSWGGSEWSGQVALDSHFSHPGVTFVASSGDSGAPISWPSSSPNVLAVGGTTLSVASDGTWLGETGWSGSGGGPSAYFSQPSYQQGVVTQTTTKRANPDVAYNASPSYGSAFAIYDSFTGGGGWLGIGGTSAGAPQWAALIAIANQGRALASQAPINATDPQEVMTVLYNGAGTGMFRDVTSGTSTGSPHYSAGTGYDYVTGLGSPVANLVVQAFSGNVSVTPPAPSDTLVVTSSPTTTTAGNTFNLTITAQTPDGSTDTGYTGTVHFSSSDVQAGLPSDYTFTTADGGSHTFTVTLCTAGSQWVDATDVSSGADVKTAALTVTPADAATFTLIGLPSTTSVGAPLTFTVTAYDAYGNVATGYTGTVHFTSADGAAVLPADYTFTAADNGAHTFSITFGTAGFQNVTVTDFTTYIGLTSSYVSVAPAAPTSLTATASSSSQVVLTWGGSTGATGYTIERSTNGSNGWSLIGTTGAGVTTYTDSNLAAGTTYYYRVTAVANGMLSDHSNTANATTTGTPVVATATSLWSSTYTPWINAFSWGSLELGTKFTSDVAGTITGMKFYKPPWMNGFVHIGHLWSSTGVLLATARFTNETRSGWQQVTFSNPVAIQPGTTYVVSYSTGGGFFGITTNYFRTSGYDNGTLHAPSDRSSGGNGVLNFAGRDPIYGASGMNFWTDVVFAAAPTATPGYGRFAIKPAVATATASVAVASPPNSTTAQGRTTQAAAVSSGATTSTTQWPYRHTVNQATTIGTRNRGSIFH